MKFCATILFFFILSTSVAQVDFVAAGGVLTQNPLYAKKYKNQIKRAPIAFLGCGVNYRINNKLSIDQVIFYHHKDNQIPEISSFDLNVKAFYLNMHIALNYKIHSKWETTAGFRLGSVFVTENLVQSASGFISTDKNDIVFMAGLKRDLSSTLALSLKQDLFFLQKQEYFSWFYSSVPREKIGIISLGLEYRPFKRKTK